MTTHDTSAQPPARGAREPVVVHHLPGGLRSTLEAVLMVVDEPVSVADLAAAFGVGESEVRANLEGLEVEYRAQQRGFTLREVDGTWRMYSRPAYADAVETFADQAVTGSTRYQRSPPSSCASSAGRRPRRSTRSGHSRPPRPAPTRRSRTAAQPRGRRRRPRRPARADSRAPAAPLPRGVAAARRTRSRRAGRCRSPRAA